MSIRDVDTHKLSYHPERVAAWLRGETVFPLHVEMGITNRCNHRCKFCALDWITHGANDISTEVLLRTTKDMANAGVKSIYFAGEGEPTLHKDFSLVLNKAKEYGLSCAVSTNGSNFTKDVCETALPALSWIRFSVDAATKETHSKLHGVSTKEFSKILNNIENCVKVKHNNKLDVDIGVQLMFMPDNSAEIEKLAHIVKDIGVDNFQIKPVHNHPKSGYSPNIYDFSQAGIWDRLKSLETDDFSVIVRTRTMERIHNARTYTECYGFQFYSLIDAKGNVVPCNVFYNNPDFVYGNLYNDSFSNIWLSDNRKDIIKKVTNLGTTQCGMYRCRLDVMNRYLERVKHPERNDEFI